MSVTSQPLHAIDDTRALAQRLAAAVRPGDTLLLQGDLGTGKTSFAQCFIAALSPQPVEVTSPTFTLVQQYPVTLADGQESTVHHYDLYRIDRPQHLAELGLDDAAEDIRLIEWPERLGENFAPDAWLSLHFTLQDGDRRVALRHSPAMEARGAR